MIKQQLFFTYIKVSLKTPWWIPVCGSLCTLSNSLRPSGENIAHPGCIELGSSICESSRSTGLQPRSRLGQPVVPKVSMVDSSLSHLSLRRGPSVSSAVQQPSHNVQGRQTDNNKETSLLLERYLGWVRRPDGSTFCSTTSTSESEDSTLGSALPVILSRWKYEHINHLRSPINTRRIGIFMLLFWSSTKI